jgi:hypothetical protein
MTAACAGDFAEVLPTKRARSAKITGDGRLAKWRSLGVDKKANVTFASFSQPRAAIDRQQILLPLANLTEED